MNWILVFFGGGLGSIVRFGFSYWFGSNTQFPYATLYSNLLSSLLAGFFIGYFSSRPELFTSARFLLLVGFCGGFSTFSTFSAETFELFRHGMISQAFYNITANLAGTLLMVWIGWFAGKSFA